MNGDENKRQSGKRPKKRKFTGNVHTRCLVENVPEAKKRNSASGKKIKLSSDEIILTDTDFYGYSIVDLNLIFTCFQNYLCCKICGSDVTFKEEVVTGLSTKISVQCANCNELCTNRNSKMLGNKKNIPEINRRFMYAFRALGLGHAAMKLFCGLMDLPKPVSQKSYDTMTQRLLSCTEEISHSSKQCAAKEEVKATGSADIIISGDGTWKTRGHTSRVGICTIIGDKTGKIIDTEVLSSYCKSCDTWKGKSGTEQDKNWVKHHEKECHVNHTGSAGKMEVVGMKRIFERSKSLYDARYTSYIGDGDAKTFLAVSQSFPYGPDFEIKKIECVGHIQKRMGTRLRKLKSSGIKCSDGKSVGGKGRLTDRLIDKLTVYYGNAIRESKNSLSEMRKAIWAIYFHTRSSDTEPLHNFCPTGPDSWCKYQKSLCEGSLNVFKHGKSLPAPVMDVIKPIFNDLSHPKLLSRCLGGKTQNANESFNSLVWKICPKTQYCGKRIVEIATNEATVLYNEGNIGRIKIMETFGLKIGLRAINCLKKLDERRIAKAELQYLQSTKEARKAKRRSEKVAQENFTIEEGPMYAAGGF